MIAEITDEKTIRVYDLEQFDIDAIVHSGQVFRYFPIEGGFRMIVGDRWADVLVKGNTAEIRASDARFFYNYFDFGCDYRPITASFGLHKAINDVLSMGKGIRILRAEFAETVISFVLSANNNIRRFTKTLNLLCEKYGRRLDCGEFGFPSPEVLQTLSEADFAALGCGYRSGYLVKTVKSLLGSGYSYETLSGFDNAELRKHLMTLTGVGRKETAPFLQAQGQGFPREEELRKMSKDEFIKVLMTLPGVGLKVASCVALFSDVLSNEERFRTCPVDVHIARALEQLGRETADAIMNHKYAGVAQQYIFYYTQHLKKNFKEEEKNV